MIKMLLFSPLLSDPLKIRPSRRIHLRRHQPSLTMGDEKQGTIVIGIPLQQNPVTQIQTKLKEIETGFKSWLSKQSIAVEAAVVTATGAFQGAAIGGLMGTLSGATAVPTTPPGSALNPQALASLQQAQVFIQFFDFNFDIKVGIFLGF